MELTNEEADLTRQLKALDHLTSQISCEEAYEERLEQQAARIRKSTSISRVQLYTKRRELRNSLFDLMMSTPHRRFIKFVESME